MSTSIDVYKISDEYKKLSYYDCDHVSYDEEYLIYTLGVFDRVIIITDLFNITFDKHIQGSGRGLFDADYLITLHEFESAKTAYFNNYNCDILVQN